MISDYSNKYHLKGTNTNFYIPGLPNEAARRLAESVGANPEREGEKQKQKSEKFKKWNDRIISDMN